MKKNRIVLLGSVLLLSISAAASAAGAQCDHAPFARAIATFPHTGRSTVDFVGSLPTSACYNTRVTCFVFAGCAPQWFPITVRFTAGSVIKTIRLRSGHETRSFNLPASAVGTEFRGTASSNNITIPHTTVVCETSL